MQSRVESKSEMERTSSSSDSSTVKAVPGSTSPASRGTHCTCSNVRPTSHGTTIALAENRNRAEYRKLCARIFMSQPSSSPVTFDERSSNGLVLVRVDHWYVEEEVEGTLFEVEFEA